MHEIAHILLNHQPTRIGGILVREYTKEYEEQAAYLGGCLQVPKKALQWAYQLEMTRKQVADRFGASLEMVRWRCNDTGFAEKIR
jgi:Zn-dependent peptidase ImmA (M78 family)